MTSRLRALLRIAGIATIATVGLTLGAATAAAHSSLVESSPADGDTVAELPAEVVLTFSDKVQTGYTEVAVLYDDVPLGAGEPMTDGDTVTQMLGSLPADATAGDVTVSFRIVSADGHPVDGTFTFTVEPADSGTPTDDSAQDSGTAAPAAGAGSDDGSTSETPTGTLVAIGVAVAAVIAVAGVAARRRLRRDGADEDSLEGPTA